MKYGWLCSIKVECISIVVIQFNAFLENTHIFQNNTIMGQFLIDQMTVVETRAYVGLTELVIFTE